MPKAILEKELCSTCGVDVREGSQFCYNCGEAIDGGPPPPAILKPDEPISARPIEPPRSRLDIPAKLPASKKHETAIKNGPGRPETRRTSTPPRSRIRAKAKEKVEFEWVEPSRSPLVRFLVTAIILAVFAGLMLLAAAILK